MMRISKDDEVILAKLDDGKVRGIRQIRELMDWPETKNVNSVLLSLQDRLMRNHDPRWLRNRCRGNGPQSGKIWWLDRRKK